MVFERANTFCNEKQIYPVYADFYLYFPGCFVPPFDAKASQLIHSQSP